MIIRNVVIIYSYLLLVSDNVFIVNVRSNLFNISQLVSVKGNVFLSGILPYQTIRIDGSNQHVKEFKIYINLFFVGANWIRSKITVNQTNIIDLYPKPIGY